MGWVGAVTALAGLAYGERQKAEQASEARRMQRIEAARTMLRPFTGGREGQALDLNPGRDAPLAGLLVGAKLGQSFGDFSSSSPAPADNSGSLYNYNSTEEYGPSYTYAGKGGFGYEGPVSEPIVE